MLFDDLNSVQSNILAISASTATCSIVLYTPQQCYDWHTNHANQHSEELLPAIQSILRQANLKQLNKTDYIVLDIGPGAFTSVRIACAITQGLTLGWECKVITIESLTALIYQYVFKNQLHTSTYIMSVIDAKMNEYYTAQYFFDFDNHSLTQTIKPMLIPYKFQQTIIYQQSSIVIGNFTQDSMLYLNTLNNLDDALNTSHKSIIYSEPLAFDILIAAQQSIKNNIFLSDIESIQPIYVRNQVALTIKERYLMNQ